MWTSYLALAEEHASWLEEKSRDRVIRGVTVGGSYFILFHSNYSDESEGGIVIQFEDNGLSPIIYPIKNNARLVETFETKHDYFYRKLREKV